MLIRAKTRCARHRCNTYRPMRHLYLILETDNLNDRCHKLYRTRSCHQRTSMGTWRVALLHQVLAKGMLPMGYLSNDLRGFLIVQNRTSRPDRCCGIFSTRHRSHLCPNLGFFYNLPCKFIPCRSPGIHHVIDAILRVFPQQSQDHASQGRSPSHGARPSPPCAGTGRP